MRTKEVTNIFKNAGIAKRWWEYSLSDVIGYDNLKEFDHTERGIILLGKNGVGKTMFMNCYFIDLIEKTLEGGGSKKLFLTSLHDLIELYITRNKNPKYHALLEYDLVGIDDIGDSYLSGGAKEMSCVVLNHFLRKRFDNCVHTWLTANLDLKGSIEDYFGERLASFIREACIFVNVKKPTDARMGLTSVLDVIIANDFKSSYKLTKALKGKK